jgi:hypothetical protein
MDTPIRRDAEVVKDDLRERHGLSETQADGNLSTADLAGVQRETPTNVRVEPLGEGGGDKQSRAIAVEDTRHVDTAERTANSVQFRANAVRSEAAGGAAAGTARAPEEETGPLFSGNEANELRAKWDAVQVGFVDAPRDAVEHADNLVAETMKRLAEVFAAERTKLEGQWNKGEDVSTEDLRLALRRYRSFFSRLLSI